MHHEIVVIVAAVLAGGVVAQWIGWRLRMPPIVFLLAGGLIAGPVLGVLDLDAAFGDVLLPMVSMAVAVILFEGGLGLGVEGLRVAGRTVWMLLSVGALITMIGTLFAAIWLLGMDTRLAALLAATLVVTGPTVVGPIVHAIGLRGRVAAILETEGTLIDCLGAIITVLVSQAAYVSRGGVSSIAVGIGETLGVGIILGLAGAAVMMLLFGWYLIPDELDNVTTLATVLTVFAVADGIRSEAGLVAATVMGIAMASQRRVSVHHVLRFNETLRIMFISILFVLLAARITPETLRSLEWRNVAFLAVLVVAVRPVSVFVSTLFSKLSRNERVFLALTAPRGIVAASIASVFALRLDEVGVEDSQVLVSAVFTVIAGTVLLAGLISRRLATRLRLVDDHDTIVVLGANPVARMFAAALADHGALTRVVDLDRDELARARMSGLDATHGSVLANETWAPVADAAAFVAMTGNDELNALAARHAGSILRRKQVFQLPPMAKEHHSWWETPLGTFGRPLFGGDATFAHLSDRLQNGWKVVPTTLSASFGLDDHRRTHPDALTLFVVGPRGDISLVSADVRLRPKPGDTIVALAAGYEPREATRAAKRAESRARAEARTVAAETADPDEPPEDPTVDRPAQ